MIIYLLNNHEAVIADDKRAYITVEPRHDGILSVDGVAFPVLGNGSTTVPDFEKKVGTVFATFTTDGGIRFQVITPYMTRGIPASRIDPFEGYIIARRYVYDVELKMEKLSEELRAFKASIVHDALGFITGEPTLDEPDEPDEKTLSDGSAATSPIGGGLEDEEATETTENQNNEEE